MSGIAQNLLFTSWTGGVVLNLLCEKGNLCNRMGYRSNKSLYSVGTDDATRK